MSAPALGTHTTGEGIGSQRANSASGRELWKLSSQQCIFVILMVWGSYRAFRVQGQKCQMQLVVPESPPNTLMAKSAGILQTTLFCSLKSPLMGYPEHRNLLRIQTRVFLNLRCWLPSRPCCNSKAARMASEQPCTV